MAGRSKASSSQASKERIVIPVPDSDSNSDSDSTSGSMTELSCLRPSTEEESQLFPTSAGNPLQPNNPISNPISSFAQPQSHTWPQLELGPEAGPSCSPSSSSFSSSPARRSTSTSAVAGNTANDGRTVAKLSKRPQRVYVLCGVV